MNSHIPVHFSLLILKMLMFTLAISCLTTCNFLIHGPNIPGPYAILLFISLDLASITSPIHNWCCFCSGSISSFFLELFLHWSPVACWAPIDLGSPSFSILSSCLLILFLGFSRQEYWRFAIPFSSGSHSVWPLHHDPPVLGCPAGMAWFHWVRQVCGPSLIRLTSFLWACFQCVCLLMPSCNTYHLTWVSFILDVDSNRWNFIQMAIIYVTVSRIQNGEVFILNIKSKVLYLSTTTETTKLYWFTFKGNHSTYSQCVIISSLCLNHRCKRSWNWLV